jgi:hypothetical protein
MYTKKFFRLVEISMIFVLSKAGQKFFVNFVFVVTMQ